jgi:hypothetical protein
VATKPKKIYVTTPWGIASHVHTAKPDVYQGTLRPGDKPPTPKYKIDYKPSDEDLETFRAEMRKHADVLGFEGKKKIHLGIKKTEEEEIESLCPSSQFKPLVFDTKNNPIGDDAKLGAGSIVRTRCEVSAYDKGISLRLLQVQVKKLVPYGGGNESSGFGTEEEGYVADAGSSFGGDQTEDTSEESTGDSALDI